MKENSHTDLLESAAGLPQEFRHALSRKLRAPLNDIMGFAQLLAAETQPKDQDNNAHQILSAAKRLLEIIDRELDNPKPDAELQSTAPAGLGFDVLYIEDEPANAVLVRRTLAQRAHLRLLHASTGEAGLDLAKERLPSLILLDLNLPGIDGAEVLRRLQQDADTANIPVVVISADATPSQIERLLASGARDYLTKPFKIQNFLAVVDQIIEKQCV
jgi:CheY-like chemotaxis protein